MRKILLLVSHQKLRAVLQTTGISPNLNGIGLWPNPKPRTNKTLTSKNKIKEEDILGLGLTVKRRIDETRGAEIR